MCPEFQPISCMHLHDTLVCCSLCFLLLRLLCSYQWQEKQCMYNITLRSVHKSLLPWKATSITYWSVCACKYPGAWACAYMHLVLWIQQATCMCHIVMSFVAPRSPPHFSTYLINGVIFLKNLLNKQRVFSFSLQLLSKIFPILRRI
jgi:hypothetical protein